jgi:hypothetical protein
MGWRSILILSRSGCGSQQATNGFIDFDFDFAAIDLFLTLDTEGRPWHSRHAFWQDIFLAVKTNAVRAISNPGQRTTDLPKQVRVPVQISDGEFAFAHQLHFIESIRHLLDDDFVPFAQRNG